MAFNNTNLAGKYVIFDDEATEQDIIDTYKVITSMGVTPLSVIRTTRNTTESWIYEFVDEIGQFIDIYGGAYFRIWVTSYDKALALDYGGVTKNDLDIDNVDDSRLIYFKDVLDISDIDFFPEDLNESIGGGEPKVGDYLYCHTDMFMVNGVKEHTQGRLYEIISIDEYGDELVVIDDSGDRHSYEMSPNSYSYYGKWFQISHNNQELFDDAFEPLD